MAMNYYDPYNPALMAQQQRLQQMQMQYPQFQQQAFQQSTLNGRVVDDISTVTANEVPMDGSFGIFPKRDMSEIYIRSWSSDGTIKTLKFVPKMEEVDNSSIKDEKSKIDPIERVREVFAERFDSLDARLESIEKQITPKSNSRVRKESDV